MEKRTGKMEYLSEDASRDAFRTRLLQWFKENQRELPWRRTREPYPVWISEVMLQQTQVATVIPYFHRFMNHFPTVQALANADLQQVLKVWEGLGYYARARHAHRAARVIVQERNGQFPTSFAEWKTLPGVGNYIAAAVASIVQGEAVPVVDGNVKRVLARLTADPTPVNHSRAYAHYFQTASRLLSPEEPGDFNQALMELGATVCLPRNPQCSRCPVATLCAAFQHNLQSELPRRIPRKTVPTYAIAVGVVVHNGQVLITRRKNDGLLGGLWEFPGGKIENGETPEAACKREIQEETGLTVTDLIPLATVNHAYSHFKVNLHVFVCRAQSRKVVLNGATDFKWVAPEELEQFPFPGANRKFFPALMAHFRSTA